MIDGKIYKIIGSGLTYYGSTTQQLNIRKSLHKTTSNNTSSKQIIDKGEWNIELVELFPCETREQLKQREQYYILNNDCVNKNKAYITPEERKEYTKEYYKEWYEKLNEHSGIIEKIHNPNYIVKKKYAKEWRDNHADYMKDWYAEHKEDFIKKLLEPVTCECGFECGKTNLKRHQKSKLHFKKLSNFRNISKNN